MPRAIRYAYITSRHVQSGFARYFVSISCLVLVAFVGSTFSQCAVLHQQNQIGRESEEIAPIIKDGTVVFLAISQEDYDALARQKPEVSVRMEELFDYYHYADMVKPRLIQLGYTVIAGSWHTVIVQMEEGKNRKIRFDPTDFKAILMKAKGKDPELVTDFGSDDQSIARIISKYFGINLD